MLRLPKLLVFLGFSMEGAAGLVLFGWGFRGADQTFELIVTAVGFVAFGIASWAWLRALSRRPRGTEGMQRVLRLFAAACLVLGIAYLGEVHAVYELYREPFHFGFRYDALNTALCLTGFCVAAVGFWLASMAIKPPVVAIDDDGDPASLSEEDAVARVTGSA